MTPAEHPHTAQGGGAGGDREGCRGERGQATVELGLLLPVVAIGLLAVIQVAMVARDRVLVVHAAREAARAAAVDPTPASAREAAGRATSLHESRLDVAMGPQRTPGDRLAVTVTYRSPTDIPLIGPLIGDVTLRATVTTRIE